MSRDEAGLRQGLTDELAARIACGDVDGSGFDEAEQAVLRALPRLVGATTEQAIDTLRPHFDDGAIGQIVHAYGMYRGLHTTMAAIGAEILADDGTPLSERAGFSVVTRDDGTFVARDEIDLP